MPNEFIARNGVIALNNSIITGSLTVTGGITGSLFGTSSWATNVISASYALTASNVNGGTTNYIPLWLSNNRLGSSSIYQTSSIISIGGLPSTWAPGGRVLELLDSSNSSAFFVFGANQIYYMSNAYWNGSSFLYKQSSARSTQYNQIAGTHEWATAPVGIADNVITYTSSMTLSTRGNLLLGGALDDGINILQVSGSAKFTAGVTATSFTGSFSGSLSGNTTSASYAVSASYAMSASIAFNAVTASRALNANTASYILNAASASYAVSASYALVASTLLGSVTSASYALTASNVNGGGANYIALWNGATSLSSSIIYQINSNIGIHTRFPEAKFQVSGTINVVNFRGSGSLATSSIFTVDGAAGRLFSVNDSLSGSIFSANTIAGLPVIEAFSDNIVRIGQYGQRALFVSQSRVGFGKETTLNADIDVSGSVVITGSLSTQKLLGSAPTPTMAAGTGAGTGPTISISGSHIAGYIRVLTGTAPAANNPIVTITFASAYAGLPYVVTQPGNYSASLVSGGVSGTFTTASTTGFTIFSSGPASLRGATAHTWSYHVIG